MEIKSTTKGPLHSLIKEKRREKTNRLNRLQV